MGSFWNRKYSRGDLKTDINNGKARQTTKGQTDPEPLWQSGMKLFRCLHIPLGIQNELEKKGEGSQICPSFAA